MEPSREIDALVGSLVFGYKIVEQKAMWGNRPEKHIFTGTAYIVLPRYSKSMFDVESVLDRLNELGHSVAIVREKTSKVWSVLLSTGEEGKHRELPLAVCLAALQACKANVGKETSSPVLHE